MDEMDTTKEPEKEYAMYLKLSAAYPLKFPKEKLWELSVKTAVENLPCCVP